MKAGWRFTHLLEAPHRLAFFLAVCVLVFASGWWVLVQGSRMGLVGGLQYSVSPSLLHAAVMTFGFMPLFFAGFLFTAGPKWLGMGPVPASLLVWPLLLQAVGWMLWIAGGHTSLALAIGGVSLALAGMVWTQFKFWGLLRRSVVPDRLHATAIGVGGAVGVISVVGFLLALAWDAQGLARVWVLTGLWGCVVTTYVAVAHRMIPFFTSSAVPMTRVWRPVWVMMVLLVAVVLEIAFVWLDWLGITAGPTVHGAMLVRGLIELAVGGVVVWLGFVWGFVQSLKVRLLAMLHIGFIWLGLSFLVAGLSQVLGFRNGVPQWSLGALHALTMGFLGSVMVAMVTRVSSGHSGRPLVADNRVWVLFGVLQMAVLMRIAGAEPGGPMWLLALAALAWFTVVTGWGVRLMAWYGRPRADGQAG